MNISEAVRTQSLLAWLTATEPATDSGIDGVAVVDARFLADRARRALGAGPDADQIEAALRERITAVRASGERPQAPDRLVRIAQLLQPCPRPDVEGGWTWCAHAEPWPCVITRAAWIAAGQEAEATP
jgi:hypothetical protein